MYLCTITCAPPLLSRSCSRDLSHPSFRCHSPSKGTPADTNTIRPPAPITIAATGSFLWLLGFI